MKLSHSVKICAIFLVFINLVVFFCTIWLFLRIIPAIDLIVKDNLSSIESVESMLTSLSVVENEGATKKDLQSFKIALRNAKKNISKEDEKIALNIIDRSYQKAFQNDIIARKELKFAIDYLFQINRDEILRLKKEASQVSMAGAWGLVFMVIITFFITMLYLKKMERKVLNPLDEMYDVIKAYKMNDRFRRCSGINVNKDIRLIYNGINELLDERIKDDE
jgi:hypothetical protein